MQSYFNPTKRNMKKKIGVTLTPPSKPTNQPRLNRVKTNKSTSKQHRKLKFGMQSYINPNKEIKQLGHLPHTSMPPQPE
jgi:hypothetical protein